MFGRAGSTARASFTNRHFVMRDRPRAASAPDKSLGARRLSDVVAPTSACLNCGTTLTGAYCAECGQPRVDLVVPTWNVLREAFADATDIDGRLLRTARALLSPGKLTLEFLRGRRVPYVGPLKLFLMTGAALSATWALTRGVDARYYGFDVMLNESANVYIGRVVRGLLGASAALAFGSWIMWRGTRRLLDEAVFSLHITTAVALGITIVIWSATAWKLAWGTVGRVPRGVPSLIVLVFLPAAAAALMYVAAAVRNVYGLAWVLAALRTIVFAAIGLVTVWAAVVTFG